MFRKRRGTEDTVLGETRMALRSTGVNVLEAIVDDLKVAQGGVMVAVWK